MTDELTGTERIEELEVDNRRLRRLLEQTNAPAELRHRIRTTLGMLRTILRRSAQTDGGLENYVAHLEDRLDSIARTYATIDTKGVLDLNACVAEELFRYRASEPERLTLSGPAVELQPRAGQTFAMAVHELAVNSVEHGALGAGAGRVEVSWSRTGEGPDHILNFSWKEFHPLSPAPPPREGFGTEVLTHMLAHELGATTTMTFESDGLRCAVRFPLTAPIGRFV